MTKSDKILKELQNITKLLSKQLEQEKTEERNENATEERNESETEMSMGGSIAKNAAMGAAAGAAIAPPFGAIAGTVIGGAKGYFDGKAEQKAAAIQRDQELTKFIQVRNAKEGVKGGYKGDEELISELDKAQRAAQTADTLYELAEAGASMYGSIKPSTSTGNKENKEAKAEGGELGETSQQELTEFKGPRHEEGGVPLQNSNTEVEGGETAKNGFVYSDRIKVPGTKKTFAQVSKEIERKYSQRENDPYDTKAKEEELAELAQIQEIIKQKEELSKKYGKELINSVQRAEGGNLIANPKIFGRLKREALRRNTSTDEILKDIFETKLQMEMGGELIDNYSKGGKLNINISPSKKGTFTAAAMKHSMEVQEFADYVLKNKNKFSPIMVKKANFARNAAKWKKAEGGPVDGEEEEKKKTANAGQTLLHNMVEQGLETAKGKIVNIDGKLYLKDPTNNFTPLGNDIKKIADLLRRGKFIDNKQYATLIYQPSSSRPTQEQPTVEPEQEQPTNIQENTTSQISPQEESDGQSNIIHPKALDKEEALKRMEETSPEERTTVGIGGAGTIVNKGEKVVYKSPPNMGSDIQPSTLKIDKEVLKLYGLPENLEVKEFVTKDGEKRIVLPKEIRDFYREASRRMDSYQKRILDYYGFKSGEEVPKDFKISPKDLPNVLGKEDAQNYWDTGRKLYGLHRTVFTGKDDTLYGDIEGAIDFSKQYIGPRHLNYKWTHGRKGGELYSSDEIIKMNQAFPEKKFDGGGYLFDLLQAYQQYNNASQEQSTETPVNVDDSSVFTHSGDNMLNQINTYLSQHPMVSTGEASSNDYSNYVSLLNSSNESSESSNESSTQDDSNQENQKKKIKDPKLQSLYEGILQNIGNIYNLSQGLNKAETYQAPQFTPEMLNYNAARNNINKTYAEQERKAKENIRRNATTSGQALANLNATAVNLAENKGKALADLNMQENNTNTQLRNAAQQANIQYQMQADIINQQNEAQRFNVMSQALSNIGQNLASQIKDIRQSKKDKWILDHIGTDNIVFKDDKWYFKDSEGNLKEITD